VVPYRLSNVAGSWFDLSDPTHIAFSRIIAGLLLFPLTYAGYAWLLWRHAGLSTLAIVIVLLAGIPLGLFAYRYFRWLGRERERLRAAIIAGTRGRIMVRLRAERRRLVQLLDRARDVYLAWVAITREGPGLG
jgi:hypothetical protein